MKLIDIHNATIYRHGTLVFDDLTLSIDEHESVAILGPNGSGKTTLLKTANRELYPVQRRGSWVKILGRDDWNVWELREHIGVVSHDLHSRYTPRTSALEVVVSGFHSSIGVHGVLAERVTNEQVGAALAVMQELGVAELRNRMLRSMSTGQQRRCLLARALVHRPDTLVLDEPTTGQDFAASFDYLRRIRALATRGCNVIIATHHLNEIPPEVDRVILLESGGVAADGRKADVLRGDLLSTVFDVAMRVREVDGYYLAYPG